MKAMCKYDKDSILEKAVFEELYAIQDDYEQADRLIALTERARDISKDCEAKFKQKWRAYKKQAEKGHRESKGQYQANTTEFCYFEDGHELACGNWIANQNGVL